MKPRKQIDIDELKKLRETMSIKQLAEHYKVSESLIEKRLRPESEKTVRKYGQLAGLPLGNPGAIDPNTALFFVQQENQRLLNQLETYRNQRDELRSKNETLKDQKIELERQLETAQTEIGKKPTALGGFMDNIGKGFETDPVGMMREIRGFISGKNAAEPAPISTPQIGGLEEIPEDLKIYMTGINHMMIHEGKTNPTRFMQLFLALQSLTNPTNQAILLQLSQQQ